MGRKAWVLINSVKGAEASAVAYSITETAKLNNLNPYYYYCHLFSELARLSNDKGYIDSAALEPTALEDHGQQSFRKSVIRDAAEKRRFYICWRII